MTTIRPTVRVLYTVNSNPQYILARSSSQVPCTVSDSDPAYARAPLNPCLAAICASSPELLQDPARDFSLYVLDPLEAQPPPHPSHTNSPRGVAVALGLMSWALESHESTNVFVTGTIIPSASPALEVVFALRETKRIPKPVVYSYPSYGAAWSSSAPYFHQEQRTLTRSSEFPELYIGPPRRARGRPEGSTSSKSKGESSSKPQPQSKQDVKGKSKQKQKQKAAPTHPPFVYTPLTRHASIPAFYQPSQPTSQDQSSLNALLGLLSATQSAAGHAPPNATPDQQTTLVLALQALLAANPQLLQLAATGGGLPVPPEANPGHVQGSTDDGHDDGDSDIVILDSSTVDTTAFRRPNGKDLTTVVRGASPPAASQVSATSSNQSTPLPASTPPSGQETTPASSTPSVTLASTPTATPEAKTPTSKQLSESTTSQRTLDVPATPTPCRTHKRKLDDFVQAQARPSTSVWSPKLASTSGRTRQRVPSSPSLSSPLARLPSMLGSMRAIAASGSRKQWTHENKTSTVDHAKDVTDANALKRRRTLNEFMAEHEARTVSKSRKRSSGRKMEEDTPPASFSQSAKIPPSSKHVQSSPPRPLFRSTFQPSSITGSASSNLFSSSAVQSTSTLNAASTKNPFKNFVLPAWARTSTATLPRLSEEALARQRAEQEAKKAQASLRRSVAAKAKRKRLRMAEHPSKESSDEDDEVVMDSATRQMTHPSSSVARSTPLQPPPLLLSLPVFASDAVEPIPSSPPPHSHNQFTSHNVPSTPPRKPGSESHRTPSKTGSCSLFTPSGQDPSSLFTPSTPSVTRSLPRPTFTPRSPTVFPRSGTKRSPRKSMSQAPWTPKRNRGNQQAPKTSRNELYVSPDTAIRTPQTGMGTRAFLLPPPSPCASRTLYVQEHFKAPLGSTPIVEQDKSCKEQDLPTREENAQEHATSKDIDSRDRVDVDASPPRGYASSPLPPSSPLPISPLSSPSRPDHGDDCISPVNDASVPDPDFLLPSACDSDGQGADTAWFSDDACDAAQWFTDSSDPGSAWMTEPETWLTDTEGGAIPTDSDGGAWFSDSDAAAFGDMPSSFPPSSAPNWLSDDADVDTDRGEAMDNLLAVPVAGRNEVLDSMAFQRALAVLMERGGQGGESKDQGDAAATANVQGIEAANTDIWESLRPLFLGSELNGSSSDKAARELQELLDGLVDTM